MYDDLSAARGIVNGILIEGAFVFAGGIIWLGFWVGLPS